MQRLEYAGVAVIFQRFSNHSPGVQALTGPKLDISFDNENSKLARFRRELRNPSMTTVILIAVIVISALAAPFAPGWITTTKGSFESIAEQKELNEAAMSPIGAIVPSQIAPWMATQARTMMEAEGPLDWKVVNFRTGPCDPDNLIQLPAGKYSDAIRTACGSLDEIQQHYSGNCFLASDCNIPEAAKNDITQTMDGVWNAFSDAGFVLPYSEVEDQVLP